MTCCANFSFTYLQLDHGGRYVGAVETEIERIVPSVLPYDFFASSVDVTKAQNAIRPEAIALAVFGLIAALAAILIAAQMIGRQMSFWNPEWRTLRVIGASPAMTASDGLLGIMGSVVLGSVLAGAVAVALSPLAPLGPVRPYYPVSGRGLRLDRARRGHGRCSSSSSARWRSRSRVRRAPHRATTWRRRRVASRLAGSAASAGLPASAVTGVRFALEPGAESETVPVRSAILGAVLAVTILIATVVFGSSLNSLVSHPRLYGWNWNYAMMAGGGAGDIPAKQSATLLDHDASVAAWSGYCFGNLEINGLTVPVLGGSPGAAVAPPILSGHGLDAPDQIVLGPRHAGPDPQGRSATPSAVSYGATTAHHLRDRRHRDHAGGRRRGRDRPPVHGDRSAWCPTSSSPRRCATSSTSLPAGPNAIFVRLKSGADAHVALRSLDHIAAKVSTPTNYSSYVFGVQRPAEIVNYRSMGSTPLFLGLGIDGGGGERFGPDARRVGPSPAPVDGHAADPGLHGPPAGGQRGLAVERRRRHRTRARRAARDRCSGTGSGMLFATRDLRRAQPDGGDSPDRGNRGRRTRAG